MSFSKLSAVSVVAMNVYAVDVSLLEDKISVEVDENIYNS